MHLVYSPRYHIDIGPHVYPTTKYALIYERLLAAGLGAQCRIEEPVPAAWEDLALVHAREYLASVRDGTLTPTELAELELPWSPHVVEGFRLMTGGTIVAGERAMAMVTAGGGQPRGPAVTAHIGGGFHHAFANHGEGFCLFNDVAVAIRVLQRRGLVHGAAIVDLDVHHGNGSSMIFDRDETVFTFSMHQQHNYPVFKPRSSLDIGLADGTGDATYLHLLAGALPKVFHSYPDIVFYLAGADPYVDDQLGGLALTMDGLRQRDRMVLQAARAAGVPVAIVLAGGYARHVEDTVAIHVATIEEALAIGG